MNESNEERRKSWLLLGALVAMLLLLAALRPLAVPDEGRYGEVGRWMLQSGDWLTPRLNGVPFFHKPPYLYWLEAASLATFGIHAWAVRLVPALHAVLMLVALYLSARVVSSESIARRAMLMLGTSLAFLLGGQYVNHDMLVACWMGVAIWCFALSFRHGDKPHANLARLGFVACAFGVLSKGLMGFALPGLVLLLWLLWTRQAKKMLYLPWFSGLLLFGAIALPWFVLAQAQFPEMLAYMFGKHQFGRYTATTFNNARPWWFYLVVLVILLFPWVFFAIAQAVSQLRRASKPSITIAADGLALCWIWLLAILVFFSIPNSKLVGYMLPVAPPLALLCALGWERAVAHKVWAGRAFAGLCALSLGLAVAANIAASRYTAQRGTADIAQALACQAQPGDTVYASGEFPYDLPFYTQALQPMVVVQDWPALRLSAGDNWRRELFEGADFDAAAARVLQTPDVLVAAAGVPGKWLVAAVKPETAAAPPPSGWSLVQQGRGWTLYRSAPESPVAAEHKGLPGCRHQGDK
jgi:4-amino-4-deoxy-L-arabinose transferase-like glycosyltransferase